MTLLYLIKESSLLVVHQHLVAEDVQVAVMQDVEKMWSYTIWSPKPAVNSQICHLINMIQPLSMVLFVKVTNALNTMG